MHSPPRKFSDLQAARPYISPKQPGEEMPQMQAPDGKCWFKKVMSGVVATHNLRSTLECECKLWTEARGEAQHGFCRGPASKPGMVQCPSQWLLWIFGVLGQRLSIPKTLTSYPKRTLDSVFDDSEASHLARLSVVNATARGGRSKLRRGSGSEDWTVHDEG